MKVKEGRMPWDWDKTLKPSSPSSIPASPISSSRRSRTSPIPCTLQVESSLDYRKRQRLRRDGHQNPFQESYNQDWFSWEFLEFNFKERPEFLTRLPVKQGGWRCRILILSTTEFALSHFFLSLFFLSSPLFCPSFSFCFFSFSPQPYPNLLSPLIYLLCPR